MTIAIVFIFIILLCFVCCIMGFVLGQFSLPEHSKEQNVVKVYRPSEELDYTTH